MDARTTIENWVQYLNVTDDLGDKLLKLEGEYSEQINLVRIASTEGFIKQIIDQYSTDPGWESILKRLIDVTIETSGARTRGEEIKSKQLKTKVKTTDGFKTSKTYKMRKGKRFENWSPQQEKFLSVRIKKGKTPKEIFAEYNHTKSIKFARSTSSVSSKIRRLK